MKAEHNYFNELAQINVNENTDKKGKFTYLSWAFAWAEVKKKHPDASYEIERFGEDKLPYIENELGYMVFTKVTINDITHEMWLPVMDFRNKAILKGKATMMEINKTIMRCLVKNIGMHGLGLYIYAREDLPEEEDGSRQVKKQAEPKQKKKEVAKPNNPPSKEKVDELKYLMADRLQVMLNHYKVNTAFDLEGELVDQLIDREYEKQTPNLDDLK